MIFFHRDRLIPPVIEKPGAEMININGKTVEINDNKDDEKHKENDAFLTNGKF